MKALKTTILIASFVMASSSAFAGSNMESNPGASCSGKVHQVGLNSQTAYKPAAKRQKSQPSTQYEATRGKSRRGYK